jgi:hypothetical protein
VKSLYLKVVVVRSASERTSRRKLLPRPKRLSSEMLPPACRLLPEIPKSIPTPVVHWSWVSTITSAPPGTERAEMCTGLRKPVPRRISSLSARRAGSRGSPTWKSSSERMNSSRVKMCRASTQRYAHAEVAGSLRS